jgi:hypothetical protein
LDNPTLQKILTANDVGLTGSHQAGIHVPHGLAWFFPALDQSRLNPDAWLEVVGDTGEHQWRWIYYNNGVVADGTRNEFRLTRTAAFLRDSGAREGDVLELVHRAGPAYEARIRTHAQAGILDVSTAGPWRTVSMRG